MSGVSSKFFASVRTHKDAPDKYIACYGLPGDQARWVMNGRHGKYVQLFDTDQEAELAAWRLLAAQLNGSLDAQKFLTKPTHQEPKFFRKESGERLSDETKKVFGGFK